MHPPPNILSFIKLLKRKKYMCERHKNSTVCSSRKVDPEEEKIPRYWTQNCRP